MLIKKKKLAGIRNTTGISLIDLDETKKTTHIELQRAKQEARMIKQEAENILRESKARLQEAEAKTHEIIQEASLEAKRIKEKVYKDTLHAASVKSREMINRSKDLLHELFEVKRNALEEAHKEIIKVALDLAEKIIKYQASIDSNILKTQVQEAIKKATTEADRVQVFVNSSDLNTLKESLPDLEKLFPAGIEIIPLVNDSVDPGSCIVETKSGQLDASFSTQLLALRNLVSRMEVAEPQIDLEEEEELEVLMPENVLTDEDKDEEDIEEEVPKEELLGEEPLIDMPQAEDAYPFGEVEEAEIVEIPEEITRPLKEELLPQKKKLFIGDLSERTREEAEELDESLEHEEEAEENKPISILKPKKKKPSSQVSDIASEIEKNPEWKDLVQDEDEE